MYAEKTLLMSVLPETVSPQCLQIPMWTLCCRPGPPPIFPAFLVSDSVLLVSPRWSSQANLKSLKCFPTQHTGVRFPSPPAAPGFKIPVNVCWFLSSGMCVPTSCWWIIDFVCGEIEAPSRAHEGELCLKTSVLNKIHLNGNLQAKNQLLFKWIIFRIRFLVVPENISQGCLCIFSWNNCVLAEVFRAISPFHPYLFPPVRLLELTTLVLCSFKDLGITSFQRVSSVPER